VLVGDSVGVTVAVRVGAPPSRGVARKVAVGTGVGGGLAQPVSRTAAAIPPAHRPQDGRKGTEEECS